MSHNDEAIIGELKAKLMIANKQLEQYKQVVDKVMGYVEPMAGKHSQAGLNDKTADNIFTMLFNIHRKQEALNQLSEVN